MTDYFKYSRAKRKAAVGSHANEHEYTTKQTHEQFDYCTWCVDNYPKIEALLERALYVLSASCKMHDDKTACANCETRKEIRAELDKLVGER